MESFAWYNSHTLDPYADDSAADQADINEKWNKQFKLDSIINSISKDDIQMNIDLFLKEIESEAEEDTISEFYRNIFNTIIEVFHMDELQDHADGKRSMNYIAEVRKLLLFCGKGCRNFLGDLFTPIFDINVGLDEQYIKENFNKVEPNLKELSRGECFLIRYFLQYGTTENRLHMLSLLTARELSYINAHIVLKGIKK